MTRTIHKECLKDVMKEYNRLDLKHPTVSKEIKMEFAVEYVRAVDMAETIQLFRMVSGRA